MLRSVQYDMNILRFFEDMGGGVPMMPIQKRPLSKLKLGVLYSLSESYMMLPFLIFSSLLTEKSTTVNFFVSVIIV